MNIKTIIGGNGENFSNTHRVFLSLYDTEQYDYINAGDFESLIERFKKGDFLQIILPVYNSIIGDITPALKALEPIKDNVKVLQTCPINIQHALISGPSGSIETAKTVFSFTAALDQCAINIKKHKLAPHYHPDTYGAAREVIAKDDPSETALAPPEAAYNHGGKILIDQMSDNPDNVTTFKIYSQ